MPAPRIALLGGGQLGRMFIENALRYDVEVHVLDPDPRCPCARIAHRFVQGDLNDTCTVLRFAADLDAVGIEIEHVSVEALALLAEQGKRVIPQADTLRTIKDKGLQKEFYLDHGIPTAGFALLDDGREALAHGALLPAFLKTRTGGYDGKGVMAVDAGTDPQSLFAGPCVLERRVPIAKELAVMVARAADGSTAVYDPVEMVFDPELNLVDRLIAPAREDASVLEAAKALALRVVDAFGGTGLLAVELFLTPEGTLLVNECAPRPHNSGHCTIEACHSSQFDQLLRLLSDRPLGDARSRCPSAMINIIGEGGTGPALLSGAAEVLAVPGTYIHLYGKHETRTGRKMGHLTVLADGMDTLLERVARVKGRLHVRPGELPLETTMHRT